MTLLLNSWGPAGTLNDYTDIGQYQADGEVINGAVDDAVREDRVDTVVEDGQTAFRFRRHLGDANVGSAPRTELASLDTPQIADWTGEDGFDVNEATRWYRAAFKIPSGFPIEYLKSSGTWAIPFQLHQRADDSPADIAGVPPTLAVQIKPDSYGRYRFALVRNADPDSQTAEYNAAVHAQEICSWPFRANEWQDICVYVKWSWTTEGAMTVYLNRRPILVESGVPNTSNDAPSRGGAGNYPKIGIYVSNDCEFELFHRGLIIGDYETIFADMYPELENAVPLERVSGPVASGSF